MAATVCTQFSAQYRAGTDGGIGCFLPVGSTLAWPIGRVQAQEMRKREAGSFSKPPTSLCLYPVAMRIWDPGLSLPSKACLGPLPVQSLGALRTGPPPSPAVDLRKPGGVGMRTGWSAAGLTRPKPRLQGSLLSMHGDLNSSQTRLPFNLPGHQCPWTVNSCPCFKTKIG